MNWNLVISAATGLLGGTIASLIAPWVNWRLEKVRMKIEYQRKLISDWRNVIEKANTIKDVLYTSTFTELNSHSILLRRLDTIPAMLWISYLMENFR